MQTVVQIGAGAIGRGFLGQLWTEAGYHVVFVDTDESLVHELNRRGSYPLHLVTNDAAQVRAIAPVQAIATYDTNAVSDALASCAFAAMAVGAANIESVARECITPALSDRRSSLNVLLCENGLTVRESFIRGTDVATGSAYAVETVVGRMVPGRSPTEADPLAIFAEPFHELPFNTSQWHGELPSVPGMIAVSKELFLAYELRKLYAHNGGHALLAYHGHLRGHVDIAQCAEDAQIVEELQGFWTEIGTTFRQSALGNQAIFTEDRWIAFTEDLLHRFRNRNLRDTTERVGRDPLRKLAASDRLVGAAQFMQAQGLEPIHAARAIAAALRFNVSSDTGASMLQKSLREVGVRETLAEFSGVSADSFLAERVEKAFYDPMRN